ncbi:MAG: ABC transporter permease [Candidatus Woesearchaeota archaeon]
MKIIKKLFFEQYKNFKILFRNITSLFLLILGPLTLILLIGFAYSGNELHDINLGIVSNDYDFAEKSFQNFTFTTIYKYEKTEDCIYDVNLQKLHLCIEYYIKKSNNDEKKDNKKNESNDNEIPSGTITFYFDNSKKALSNKIVDAFSDYFGNESQKISIESAKTIFANVQSLVIYLKQKSDDIDLLINQSYQIKQDLIERKKRLIEIKDEFLPIYNKSKYLQSRLNNASISVNESYDELNNNTIELLKNLNNLKKNLLNKTNSLYIVKIYNNHNNNLTENFSSYSNFSSFSYQLIELDKINSSNKTYINTTENLSFEILGKLNEFNYSIVNESIFYLDNGSNFINYSQGDFLILITLISIEKFENSLLNFKNNIDNYYNYTNSQKKEFDLAVKLMDDLNLMIEKDLELTDQYIIKIDYSVSSVREIQKDLNKNLVQLSKLEPGLAEKLIKPILQNFEPVKPGLENIKIAFPGMLAIIIIFISALFSNIVSLTEFNSKAFFRNKLSPVNLLVFIFGLIITIMLVVFLQVFVLLFVAFYSFKINVFSNFLSLFLIIFLLSLIFIFIGLIIAILIRNEQASILTTTFLVLGFFLFSDSITPIEIMPITAALFASKNPLVLAANLFRKILIFDLSLDLNFSVDFNFLNILKIEIFYLIVYALSFLILIFLLANKLKK